MSKFLVTCWPFEGHVLPQMSIALALRDAGHEVAFYSAERARTIVEGEGFTLFPFEQVDPKLYERVQLNEQQSGMRRQSWKIQQQASRNWLLETVPGQLKDLRRIIADWQPDVIITDLTMWSTQYVLFEAIPIPVAVSSTFMGPLMPGPDAPPQGLGLPAPKKPWQKALSNAAVKVTELVGLPMRREIDRIRAENGLAPMGCSVARYPGRLPLYLIANLRPLDWNRQDLGPSVHYIGPTIYHPPEKPGTVDWLATVPTDRPWVHVTEGTSHYQEPFVLQAAARGLGGCDFEAILTTGGSRDPEQLGLTPLPKNVHVTRWLSHTDLLPRCEVVVTTGGPATIMASLRAGVPLVIVPTTWDKPDNASRIVEADLGVKLAPRHCTPDGLRAAIERVLTEPHFRTNARRVAAELNAAPGPAGAVHLLEQLVQNPSDRSAVDAHAVADAAASKLTKESA